MDACLLTELKPPLVTLISQLLNQFSSHFSCHGVLFLHDNFLFEQVLLLFQSQFSLCLCESFKILIVLVSIADCFLILKFLWAGHHLAHGIYTKLLHESFFLCLFNSHLLDHIHGTQHSSRWGCSWLRLLKCHLVLFFLYFLSFSVGHFSYLALRRNALVFHEELKSLF